MASITDVPRPAGARGIRPALVVAVAASAMAGLVHAAAARGHEGDQVLVWMFALCAVAQVGWAAAVAIRQPRWVLVAGVLLNAGAVVVWAATRTVGIPFIDSLAEVEPAGTQDLAAAAFAAASAVAAVRMLAQPVVRATITPMWAGALAIVALLGAMPALRADHVHGHGDHTHVEAAGHPHGEGDAHGGDAHDDDHGDHDDAQHADDGTGHGHAEGDAVATRHAHDADEPTADGHAHTGTAQGEAAGHEHAATGAPPHTEHPDTDDGTHPPGPDHPDEPDAPDHPHPPADPGDPEPTGPIISLDDPRVTEAQRAIAQGLITDVSKALAGKTVASIKAAGYQWIGDGAGGGYQHYVNWTFYGDGIELNPARIESIVVKDNALVSGMYILNPGKTLANVPALAGPLTTWHDHQNLCFSGTTLVGLSVNGSCDPAQGGPGGSLTPTPPMLHVWLVPNPCGPFAGIETHGGGGCATHDGH